MSRRTFKIRTTEGQVREIAMPAKPRRALGAKRASGKVTVKPKVDAQGFAEQAEKTKGQSES